MTPGADGGRVGGCVCADRTLRVGGWRDSFSVSAGSLPSSTSFRRVFFPVTETAALLAKWPRLPATPNTHAVTLSTLICYRGFPEILIHLFQHMLVL